MATKGWQLLDGDSIAWRKWGDEYVAYASGEASTHLIGPAGGFVLSALFEAQSPLPAEELLSLLRADFRNLEASPAPEEMRDIVDATFTLEPILDELERIGLVESCEI